MSIKAKRYALEKSPLFLLRSKKKLADLLKIDFSELQALLRQLKSDVSVYYTEFDAKKKCGGLRRVENPKRDLKAVQKRVQKLLSRIHPPDYLYCPVKGRSYITNAEQHIGNRVVKCLDIRKYFPSTPERRVYYFFIRYMLCEPDVAAALARIACYKGHLPTGSPLSPVMSFFAYYDIWESIAGLCKRNHLTLTVYIDDITISGASFPKGLIWQVKRLIHGAGLNYHKEKSFVGGPAEITGVIVNSDGASAPNKQFKKLRELQRVIKGSPIGANTKAETALLGVRGQIRQISMFRA